MNSQEFHFFRQELQKTQKQMSELLGTSLKAVQSFEQGWRKVPVHIERQIFFLYCMKRRRAAKLRPCWEIRDCSPQTRETCPAWEFFVGDLCWFINGTVCRGKPQQSWSRKMEICRGCKVFTSNLGLGLKGPKKIKKMSSWKKVGNLKTKRATIGI